MNLYKKYLALHLKSELEYKASFIMSFLTQSFVLFCSYFVILSLFDKFGSIKDFGLYEVMLIFGVIHFGFATNKVFNRGFDNFDKLILSGDLDRILTRPRSLYLQIMGSDIDYAKMARMLEAIIILVVAIFKIDIVWTLSKIVTLIFMLISSCLVFFSIYLLGASFCFVTIQGLEVVNVFTDGGREMAQYPISIYGKFFRIFFTFIIPFGFVNYYPLLYLLDIKSNLVYVFSPLLAIIYIIPSVLIFNYSLKKYSSSGS